MGLDNRKEDLVVVSARILIYASVMLGVALLVQLYSVVPVWLFTSVLVGWMPYLVVAVLAYPGRRLAYPAALVISIVTLHVSLPQPEHYVLLGQGATPAAFTFIIGLAIQVGVIATVAGHLILDRKRKSGQTQRGSSQQ